eukprot:COSAG05_NODE_49_length_24373_cov_16.162561_31_plen_277_part_00
MLAAVIGGAAAQLGVGIQGGGCSDNDGCAAVTYTEGQVLEVAGIQYVAGGNASTAYCARLNGTVDTPLTGCWPCKFTLDSQVNGATETSEENCYTFNGMFMPVGVDGTDVTTFNLGARLAGCDTCDTVIDAAEQGGVAGTTCFIHEDCRTGSYCDHLPPALNTDSCQLGVIPSLTLNTFCNSPFECDIGTDKTDCPQYSSACVLCNDDSTWSNLQCHSMSPVNFRNFVLHVRPLPMPLRHPLLLRCYWLVLPQRVATWILTRWVVPFCVCLCAELN